MRDQESVLQVDPESFGIEVVLRSREIPVVACFWAPWSAPSAAMLARLEAIAEEAMERVSLVRVDVDRAGDLAHGLSVRTIPEVIGYHDGVQVCRFGGDRPEPFVRRALEPLLRSPATLHSQQGLHAFAAGDEGRALREYARALQLDPDHAAALLGMARLLEDRSRSVEAVALYRRIPAGAPQHAAARRRIEALTHGGGA